MNVLVIGCGKLGSKLANVLSHHGHCVSVVDESESLFSQLSDDFDGFTFVGMPMDVTVLKSAGVESCDAVAVVTADDNLNITVSQIIGEFFKVKNVVARIKDPAREKIYNHFGLKTICQTKLSCSAIFSALTEERNANQLTFGISTLSFNVREVETIMIGRSLNVVPTLKGEVILGVLDKNGNVMLNNSKDGPVLNSEDKIIYGKRID